MSQTVTQQRIEIVEASRFRPMDPTTGHMMDPDDAALHRAIGLDRRDPPPSGRGPPFGGNPGGGGPPFGGNPGGGGGGGGPPHRHPLPGGGQAPQAGNGKLIGNPPAVFAGERDKAEHFLTQWRLFAGINLNNEAIWDYYQRSMLFLTYIQGKAVSEWV